MPAALLFINFDSYNIHDCTVFQREERILFKL